MKKYFVIAILIILGILSGMTFLPRDSGSQETVIFQVEKGQSLGEISSNLKKEGVINWSAIFKGYVLLRGVAGGLQSGCYLFSPSMTISQIAGALSSGAIAKKRITIPEGFISEQIYSQLGKITQSDLAELKEYEGYLFPDTYEIPYCMEQKRIIKMMTNNFDQKTAGLKITPEIVIMASLLEKELILKEDKELASGILWKRLKVGMPLQVDAEPQTYESLGLPLKPISNPGMESIEAALYPKESLYWYYLSTSEGKTIFSKTLEEHNIAKAVYLKKP